MALFQYSVVPYAWQVLSPNYPPLLRLIPIHSLALRLNFAFSLFFLSWLCWVFVASRGLSLVAVSRDCSLVAVCGLFIVLASLVVEHMQASVGVPPGLWSMGSVVVAHRLSCPLVSGIFQDQGSNLCSLHCKVDS